MTKTLCFGVMHLITAFSITYALTGSVTIAGAVTFLEPLANTVLHYFFDKYWDHPRAQAWRARWRVGRPAAVAQPG
jgi:uncharacterized membrane protein